MDVTPGVVGWFTGRPEQGGGRLSRSVVSQWLGDLGGRRGVVVPRVVEHLSTDQS